MASARARLLAMQVHFEMRLPSMCLYCKSGWVGFAPNGRISCACMRADRQPKTPKTVHGWKVPPEAGAALMTEPGTRCDEFIPVNMFSKKAALLDALGYLDEEGEENGR